MKMRESLVTRLKNKVLKMILLHLTSEDIPTSILKELNIKQLLGVLYWVHWLFQQKEFQIWLDNDWGDPAEIKWIVDMVWNRYSKHSKEWMKSIDVTSQFNQEY